jgi:Tfp pilus assembly protein PilX
VATFNTILKALEAETKNLDNVPGNIMKEVKKNSEDATPVRTGFLKGNYTTKGGSKLSEPGYVIDYAGAVEYGTSRTPERRMMTKAAMKVSKDGSKYV